MENSAIILSAQRLKEERKRLKLTQFQFCEYLHYSSAKSISLLENGKMPLSERDAATIAAALGIREQYLLGRDNFRTFEDMKKVDASANTATLEYFKSIGFSFWPCYVWRTTVFAALCGYQLMKPYIAQNSQITIYEGYSMPNKAAVDNEFCKSVFEHSVKINQSVGIKDFWNIIHSHLNDIYYPTAQYGNLHFNDSNASDTELGLFELSENPINASCFSNDYLKSVKFYESEFDDGAGLSSSLWSKISSSEISRPLSNIDTPIKSTEKKPLRDCVKLRGFLQNSSIELLYGLSKNGVFQGFTTIENMRRIFAIVDGSSVNAINSLFN